MPRTTRRSRTSPSRWPSAAVRGAGAAVDVNVLNNTTNAFLGSNVRANVADQTQITANSSLTPGTDAIPNSTADTLIPEPDHHHRYADGGIPCGIGLQPRVRCTSASPSPALTSRSGRSSQRPRQSPSPARSMGPTRSRPIRSPGWSSARPSTAPASRPGRRSRASATRRVARSSRSHRRPTRTPPVTSRSPSGSSCSRSPRRPAVP